MGTLSFSFVLAMEGLFLLFLLATMLYALWRPVKTPTDSGDKSIEK